MNTIDRYLKLRRADLAFFQFLLEGYGRMVRVTTMDAGAGIVRLSIMPDFETDCLRVVEAIAPEFEAVWVENPGQCNFG